MAQLMPLPLTVSCFSKIQIGFTFLVPAHPGSPGKRAIKRVCDCVCVLSHCKPYFLLHFLSQITGLFIPLAMQIGRMPIVESDSSNGVRTRVEFLEFGTVFREKSEDMIL